MQKTGLQTFTAFLVLSIMLLLSKVSLSQMSEDTLGFTFKLLEVTDPTTTTRITFNPILPSGYTFVGWDFGDGNTSVQQEATNTFDISGGTTFDIVLTYNNGSNQTYSKSIQANSAFFRDSYDPELDTLATFKRIFYSAFRFPLNPNKDSASTFSRIGNMRFEWTIDGTIMDDAFKIDDSHGHIPNIYYSFDQGGLHIIKLKVYNTADNAKSIEFTRSISIVPEFSATKEKFPNVPNVFTPNGDLVNDYFEVSTSGTSRIKLMIFTRSGQLVYEQVANIVKWDGKNQYNKDLPDGVYYYIIEDLDKQYETAKGFLYIFRGK